MGRSIIPEVIPPGRILTTDNNLALFATNPVNPQLQNRLRGYKAVKGVKKIGARLRGMPGKIGQGLKKNVGNAAKMVRRAGLGGAMKIAGRKLMRGVGKIGGNLKSMGQGARMAMRRRFSRDRSNLILFGAAPVSFDSVASKSKRRRRR